MEIYTIDLTNNNRREALIENFESFIWTDRYSAFGDFELITDQSPEMVYRLAPDKILGFDSSTRGMIIESALKSKDADGKKILTVKGKSLESMLENRAAKAKDALSAATWDLVGGPGGVVASMVSISCAQAGNGISLYDVIPNLTTGTLVNDTQPSQTIKIKSGSLYERCKELCDANNIGFRITFTLGIAAINFRVYQGTDRTGLGGIEFSEGLDNLSQTTYMNSKEGYKNVAYVFSTNGSRIVTATGAETVSGFARKVLLVDALDIEGAPGETLNAALDQRGRDALSEHKAITLFDGVVDLNSAYKYNTDYFLGDLIVLVGEDGERKNMRVTEHIWSYNSEGLNSYPTFSDIGGEVLIT